MKNLPFKTCIVLIPFIGITVLFNSNARAQVSTQSSGRIPDKSEIEQLKSRVEQLELIVNKQQQLLASFEKQLAAANGTRPAETVNLASVELKSTVSQDVKPAEAASNPQSKSQATPMLAGIDSNGAFIRTSDGSSELRIKGAFMLDFRAYQKGNHPPTGFTMKRGRILAEGKMDKYFDYRVEAEFADTKSILLRDTFVRINKSSVLQLTAGHFREPFSQEELRSDLAQDFTERSLMNALAPSRSPGLMLSGSLDKGAVQYFFGAFNGKGQMQPNNNGTPELALRLRVQPWKAATSLWRKGFAIGVNLANGDSSNGTSVTGITESRSYTFYTGTNVNGEVYRAGADLNWLLGPAAVRMEYLQTNQARNGLGFNGTTLPGVVGKGLMGQFTYVLTGETKPDVNPVTPKRALFGGERGTRNPGAWELKFRYSNLQIADGSTKSNRAESFMFGFNWYLTRFLRYSQDFSVERFKDSTRTPRPGSNSLFSATGRIQLIY